MIVYLQTRIFICIKIIGFKKCKYWQSVICFQYSLQSVLIINLSLQVLWTSGARLGAADGRVCQRPLLAAALHS